MTKRALIPVFLLSSTVAVAAPPPDEEAPQDLLELRGELAQAGEREALTDVPHFRPLCDAEGYPLVGNVLPKQNPDGTTVPMYQPSAFCSEVRSNT